MSADPRLEIGPDFFPYEQQRGSSFSFNVLVKNLGAGDANNPTATVITSDAANLRIVGSATRDWPGKVIPADGHQYGLGEFAFQISSYAPVGSYIIRIEVSYTTGLLSSQRYVQSTTLQLSVKQTWQESSAQLQNTVIAVLLVVAIIVILIVAAIAALRSKRRHAQVQVSSAAVVYCRYCGCKNFAGAWFCSDCGRAVA